MGDMGNVGRRATDETLLDSFDLQVLVSPEWTGWRVGVDGCHLALAEKRHKAATASCDRSIDASRAFGLRQSIHDI